MSSSGKSYRARAPLRLGLAGGGTDIASYANAHGGAVLNVTINRFAYVSITPNDSDIISCHAADINQHSKVKVGDELGVGPGNCRLHRAVLKRIIEDFGPLPVKGMTFTSHVNSPIGSGLGSSSALVVAMVQCLSALYGGLPLGEYDIARLAYKIEREDLGFAGGSQDQFAATFGGVNFMEFGTNHNVVVNPLRLRESFLRELESSIVIYFSGVSRDSSKIIEHQIQASTPDENNMGSNKQNDKLAALHSVKQAAYDMKYAILRRDIAAMGDILRLSWEAKKNTSGKVSSDQIEKAIETGAASGAYSGKVSGAGGGGFIFFLCDPDRQIELITALETHASNTGTTGAFASSCSLYHEGVVSWTT